MTALDPVPPINEDWAIGDLAECLPPPDGGDWSVDTTGPVSGSISIVSGITLGKARDTGEWGWALRLIGWPHWWAACAFRKVPPRADEEIRCDRADLETHRAAPVPVRTPETAG